MTSPAGRRSHGAPRRTVQRSNRHRLIGHANRLGISSLAQRRTAGLRRRRARQGRHRASGLSRGGALDRAALRHRGGAGDARAHDLRLAQDRRAGAARLPDSAQPCRSAGAAAVLRDLGRGDLRPDGPHARSRRRLLLRLCRDAGRAGGGRAALRRQRRRLLRAHARQPPLRLLRHRPAADRPQQARAQAERPDALCRRGQGARRRHRHLRRAAARHRAARSPTSSI